MPKTAITVDTPRSTPSGDSGDGDGDGKAKSNGGSEETKDSDKEKEKEGGGLYDLKTRKQIQKFLEVRKTKGNMYLACLERFALRLWRGIKKDTPLLNVQSVERCNRPSNLENYKFQSCPCYVRQETRRKRTTRQK